MSITLSSLGSRCDLEIAKGAAFAKTITYKVNGTTANISGYTFTSQVRDTEDVLAATLTCTVTDASNGLFSISLTEAQTNALSLGRPYTWSLEVTVSGVTMELLRGYVCVFAEATKP